MSDRKDRDEWQDGDDAFVGRARELFNESVEELDAATLSRLNRSRNAAIEAATGKQDGLRWTTWVPATGVAAGAARVEVEAGAEMLEDLEFYSWIDLEPETASNVG